MEARLTPADRERYHRHLVLSEFGVAGQERLKAAKVLVVGGGGLGSAASLYLAATGVGTLALVDFDKVDLSNLQRQVLYGSADIGRSKALRGQARLQELNPDISIVAHDCEVTAGNVMDLIRPYHLVVDGTDRLSTRYQVNDACVLQRKMLVSAAIHRFEGQTFSYVPECGPCYRCIFPSAGEGVTPNCAEAGVLGVLPGILGTVQATEAIKLLAGFGEPLIGRLLTVDALTMRFDEFKVTRRADCAVCGDQPTIRAPQESAAPVCSADQRARIRQVSPTDLWSLLARGRVRVVDVREPTEFATACLPESRNVPLGLLLRDLPALLHAARAEGDDVVFLCRSGGRSQTACEQAAAAGLAAPLNLAGGLLAWARDVDSGFEVPLP